MKLIRKILVKVLGLKGYLRLVSRIYIRMISFGMKKEKYHELHFIKSILNKGDIVLDIGANLGYYSYVMAQTVGNEGKLLAIEPIPLFADIWKKNMSRHSSKPIKLFNCALGSEAKETVKMSIPIVDGVVRHGLTKVSEESDSDEVFISYDVPMHVGDELIKEQNISKLDFVKCDVEGFEQYVIPSLDKTIDQFKPAFQIELSGEENRQNVVDYLVKKDYQIFILKNHLLKSIQKSDIFSVNQDFYFINASEIENYKSHMS